MLMANFLITKAPGGNNRKHGGLFSLPSLFFLKKIKAVPNTNSNKINSQTIKIQSISIVTNLKRSAHEHMTKKNWGIDLTTIRKKITLRRVLFS